MKNSKLRKALQESNVKQWELAKVLNINEFSMSRKLRDELSEKELKECLQAIKKIVSEREAV